MDINKKYLFKRRKLYIEQEITQELSNAIIDLLDSLVEYDKFKGNIRNKELTVICNSGGGAVIFGLEIYHKILSLKELGYKITTIASNYTASMGTCIFMTGDIRKVGKCVNFLVHCPMTKFDPNLYSTLQDVERETVMLSNCWKNMMDTYLDNGSVTVRELNKVKKSNADRIYNADECVKYGYATQII